MFRVRMKVTQLIGTAERYAYRDGWYIVRTADGDRFLAHWLDFDIIATIAS